jgi:hypothetical protein
MVYNTQNYRVFWLCPSSGILETRKHNVSETGSFSYSGRGEDTYSVAPLERTNLNHWLKKQRKENRLKWGRYILLISLIIFSARNISSEINWNRIYFPMCFLLYSETSAQCKRSFAVWNVLPRWRTYRTQIWRSGFVLGFVFKFSRTSGGCGHAPPPQHTQHTCRVSISRFTDLCLVVVKIYLLPLVAFHSVLWEMSMQANMTSHPRKH